MIMDMFYTLEWQTRFSSGVWNGIASWTRELVTDMFVEAENMTIYYLI